MRIPKAFAHFWRKEKVKDWKFHCSVLGVRENASPKEIRRAYRRLALLRHPDKHNNSSKAKEDFQQLNESYHYLLNADGNDITQETPRPSPQARSQPWVQPQAKSRPAPQSPATRGKQGLPALARLRPKSFAQIWMHAAFACALLFAFTLWSDRPPSPREPAGVPGDSRNLLPTAHCAVSPADASSPPLFGETVTEAACEQKCQDTALLKQVSCSWDRREFFTSAGIARKPQPSKGDPFEAMEAAAIKAKAEESSGRCEILVLRDGPREKVYRAPKMATCRELCSEAMSANPRHEVRCQWERSQFSHQAAAPPPVETTPPTLPQKTVADPAGHRWIPETSHTVPPPQVPLATCFMSFVAPGDVRLFELENETETSCVERCQSEIIARPYGQEVQCSFLGKRLVTYVPDPVKSYVASRGTTQNPRRREPAQARIESPVGSCELSVWKGGTKLSSSRPMRVPEEECWSRCGEERDGLYETAEISCMFQGEEFHRAKGLQRAQKR